MRKTTSTSPPSSVRQLQLGLARVTWTGTEEGDLREGLEPSALDARRRAVVDRPWSAVHQVHGADVVVVTEPGHGGGDADALVTVHPGAALSIRTADCAAVAFASPEGVIGAAHAGWRGLLAGVVEATVEAMRGLGATEVQAALGPCIHPGCYEFAASEIDPVAARYGEGVRGQTTAGALALDVPAAVRSAVGRAGAELVHVIDICTACSSDHWSHRARADAERQAMVVWRP